MDLDAFIHREAVKLSRWQRFMDSLKLDERVDFEEGDIGLAGGADEVKRPLLELGKSSSRLQTGYNELFSIKLIYSYLF